MTLHEVLIALLVAVLGALGTWVTTTLIPFIKSRTEIAAQETINFWVSTAVTAAEQMFTGTDRGKEKKAYVESFLIQQGFDIDSIEAKAIIESAVLKLKSGIL